MVGLGSKNASATALQGGEVHVILSDYIWVNRQRAEGANYTFVPHSSSDTQINAEPWLHLFDPGGGW